MIFNPYPADIYCPEECCLLCSSAANIQVHLRLDFIMETNSMNPDQTAPKGAD